MNKLVICATIVLLLVLFAIVRVAPLGKQASISQHASAYVWSYVLFGLSLSFFGSVILLFLQTSFAQATKMPTLFYLVLPAGYIFLFITAWIPDKGKGRLSQTHQYAAFCLALLMTAITGLLVFAGHVTIFVRILSGLITFWYLYTIYLWLFVKSMHRYYLVLQTINLLSFFTIILSALWFS